MAADDRRVRAELVAKGALFDGYHPRMRNVNERNAARLLQILDAHGWPGRSLVGEDAADAAWLILQHAIGNPALQRRGLFLLRKAAESGEASATQVAMLEDRIRSCEGKSQLYGTQFDWNEQGELIPLPIEDMQRVDERRRAIGLMPLVEAIHEKRAQAVRDGERPPQDWSARQREKETWLRETGWKK